MASPLLLAQRPTLVAGRNGMAPRATARSTTLTVTAARDRTAHTTRKVPAPQQIHKGAAKVGAMVAGLAVALPARATEMLDQVYREDFDVQFMGTSVDHKLIIYAIVLGQFVGFVGATVSGLEAKKRKDEVLKLNEKLLGINKELRKLAREGGFAHSSLEANKEGMNEDQVAGRENVIKNLRRGKELLRATDSEGATASFKQSLEAIKQVGDALESPWKAERKALRGLGAAAQLQGKHKDALAYMMQVLAIVEAHKSEMAETTDTLGVIADIYTDLGNMEQAAVYYDRYLETLQD